jgi:hypothetical protein
MTCFQVTSFGGRTVQEKYPNSLWRRLTYIPVGDSPEERAEAGTFLNPAYAKLETTNNNAFSKHCYVSVACLPVVSSRNLSNLSAGRVIISAQQLANLRLLHAHIIQETFPQPFLLPMLPPVWNTYPRPRNGDPYLTSDTGTGLAPNFFTPGTSAGVGFQSGDGLGGDPTDGVDRMEDFDGVDDIIEDGLSAFSSSNPYPDLRAVESQPADSGSGVPARQGNPPQGWRVGEGRGCAPTYRS